MIGASELKKGITIEINGQLYRVIDYQHIKIGRGSAQLRLKLRDVMLGHTVERTFQASEKFNKARLDQNSAQYLYSDNGLYYFMDNETFEQIPLTAKQLGDAINYLKESIELVILSYKDKPLGVEMPTSVDLQVTETGPGFKGDTATAGNKPATMETGIVIQVPMFIDTGDIVKVDTRTGKYMERASG
ncbi:MAG: elongation factor P [Dehalococcoidia bacterium]|nr:elongation factor P [Dehalococcoidia bacterium]